VRSSILFTGDDNAAAQRAYLALGYVPIGDYRLAFLQMPMSLMAATPGGAGSGRS
jgi:hypothetical protein